MDPVNKRRDMNYVKMCLMSLGAMIVALLCQPDVSSASVQLVPKPTEGSAECRAHVQPTLPAGTKEIPFVETAPTPMLTSAERDRGYLLFGRPVTEPVYPNTRPWADERLEDLVTFAAPGQFQAVSLGLYPVRPLVNLKVRVSALVSPVGEIPAARIDPRLVTYWNIGYPSYESVKTYRRTPELLERVTVHSSPAGECQRYWLTIHVPENAKPGLYVGRVTISDDGFAKALNVPLSVRVLGYQLVKDPAKHYSAYYYTRDRAMYKNRSDAFIRKAADNDYRAMVDFGLDMLPTLYMNCPDGRQMVVNDADEIQPMLKAGLHGPVPVTADDVISRIYRDTTPTGKIQSHWRVDPLPPPLFDKRVTDLFRAFEIHRKAQGWPEFIYCPIDEVDPSFSGFGARVYAALKAAGVRTYATKDPLDVDAKVYAPNVDIWCSQPYSVTIEQIAAQQRHEFWCYPNHNACEIKDCVTMCKGGRMTYGFGFWRSGYTTLIPWHWSWVGEPDAFDYLRGRYSGCGQRMDDDGEVIPAVYWACFRAGCDDAKYIYTLQQAVVDRQGAKSPACQAAMRDARQIVQETWQAIYVQAKYLDQGMWPSDEFDAIRWRLAEQTERLLKFPATTRAVAPSVLIQPADMATTKAPIVDSFAERGSMETVDLGGDFREWENGTAEGHIQITDAARHKRKTGLHWTVNVDWEHDGGEGGNYPIGWPRLNRHFKLGQLDLSRFDALVFWIRVASNRDAALAGRTLVGVTVSSHKQKRTLFEKEVNLPGGEGVWIPLRFSVKEMIAASGGDVDPWKSISILQLFISESNYAHGTRLVFDVGEVMLQRLTEPTLVFVDAPRHILLSNRNLTLPFEVAGKSGVSIGTHTLTAALETTAGVVKSQTQQDLALPSRLAIPLKSVPPGEFVLRLTIRGSHGKICSQWTQPVTIHAGPLAP